MMYDWIEESWTSSSQRKSGSIVATDNKLRAQSRRGFSDALITETTFPRWTLLQRSLPGLR